MKHLFPRFNIILFSYYLFIFTSCDWPFNTNTTDNVFNLTANHDIIRVMHSALVLLSWDEITIEDFVSYKIEKIRTNDTSWTTIATLSDPFQVSYVDTIFDDEDLVYRIGIIDIDAHIIWASVAIDIPRTTSIMVPDEFETIQTAFISDLTDDDDTIYVKSGHYIENILLLGKDIFLRSEEGATSTIIDGNNKDKTVVMNSSTIEGFTIINGNAIKELGGGLLIEGDGIVRNCVIEGNFAKSKGGGIYINGNGSVYNSIINDNASSLGRGIYVRNCHGEIINNTLVSNDIVIGEECSGLILRNNILHNSYQDITFIDQTSQTGVTIDYSIFDSDIGIGSNNFVGDPKLADNIDFKLSPDSPCIDTGHPDNQYLDVDGSRNDIGAYGGPRGMK
ncbi:hypothetical protein ACFL5D_00280 [Candidatus Neomarinimicrobiota bacterium]